MMEKRIAFHGLIILVTLILLSSPALGNSTAKDSELIDQQFPSEGPDVSITNLTFSDTEPDEDEIVTISVTVKNNESKRIENLNIRLMRFDENITDREISVGVENETTFHFEWEAVGGIQTISAILTMEIENEMIQLDIMSEDVQVEPEPMGDIYTPMLALAFIFIVIFGSVLIPSILFSITNKSSLKDEKR